MTIKLRHGASQISSRSGPQNLPRAEGLRGQGLAGLDLRQGVRDNVHRQRQGASGM